MAGRLTEQLRWATSNKLSPLSILTCSPSQVPCVKRSGKPRRSLAGGLGPFPFRVGRPLRQRRLCGEKEGLVKPGSAGGSCQQVGLAGAPVASCLWPSPVDKSSYRGDIVLRALQGAVEPLYSAKNHNSPLIRSHWYLCWARLGLAGHSLQAS